MRTRTLLPIMLVAALVVVTAAHRAKAQLVFAVTTEDTSVVVTPSGVANFSVTIHNLFFGDVSVRLIRTKNELPDSTWVSALCTGESCYPPWVDSLPILKIPAGKSKTCKLTVVAGTVPDQTAYMALMISDIDRVQTEHYEFSVRIKGLNSSVRNETLTGAGMAYPNPAHSSVRIPVPQHAGGGPIVLELFDMLGNRVLDVSNAAASAVASGSGSVEVDLTPLVTGAYYYRLVAGTRTTVRSIAVAR